VKLTQVKHTVERLRDLVTQWFGICDYYHCFQQIERSRDLVTQFYPRTCFDASIPDAPLAIAEPAGRFHCPGSSLCFPAYSATCVGFLSCSLSGIPVLCRTFVVLHCEGQARKKYDNSYTYIFECNSSTKRLLMADDLAAVEKFRKEENRRKNYKF
jgi:hypothetical protein